MNFYIYAFLGALFVTVFGYDFAWADVNEVDDITNNIVDSIDRLPGFVTAISYMLGLLFGVTGILKLRDHVEAPTQTKLQIPLIRFAIGGAFFALPIVYEAMETAINGTGAVYQAMDEAIRGGGLGIGGTISSLLSGWNFAYSSETQSVECLSIPVVSGLFGNSTMGQIMCQIITSSAAIPAFLNALAYVFGLIFGFWGILKIKEHVLNPTQTPVWDGVTRLLAAGAFFSLPIVIESIRMTMAPANLVGMASAVTNTGFNDL